MSEESDEEIVGQDQCVLPDGGGRIAVVLGASGYMGSNMVPALAAQGLHVRATARNPAVLEAREWGEDVDCLPVDVLEPESLPPVLEGAD
ncbi:MAG: NAD(P)H-binding protein, partial [Gammaproteobacteria bacterium]